MWFLWEKWGIHVHRFTIFRILKKRHWSEKRRQRVDIRQNDELRLNRIASLSSLRRRKVSSSSNWAISADRVLFSCDLWALTRSAASACRWSSTAWASRTFFAALKLSMICLLKLREQLALTAASAVFALAAASTMILAAASGLTLRAASALTLPEGFFVDEVLEGMSESSRGSFWLRRDDGMMASRLGEGLKGC